MRGRTTYRFPFAAYPAVRIMCLIMAGILIAAAGQLPVYAWVGGFGLSAAVWLFAEVLLRKRKILAASHTATPVYFLMIITAAASLYSVSTASTKQVKAVSKITGLYAWETAAITGKLNTMGKSGNGRYVYDISVTETVFPERVAWKQPYGIRLYGASKPSPKIRSGNTITAEVRFYGFPERRNPHEFDYGEWLINTGFAAHGELTRVINVETEYRFGWEQAREAVRKNAESLFGEKHSHLANALLLGYKADLTPEIRQHFARAGLSHIMAVSGLHVGFIIAPFWFLIPFFWGSRAGRWSGLIILTLLLLGYAGLTGFSASVSRASLMAWLLAYGKLFHKVRNSVNITAVAAIVILLIQPSQLFDVGFQLSFSAVFIILLLMPEVQQVIPQRHRYGFVGGLLTLILVSAVVQAGLFPLLAVWFGEFSVAGPIANVLVVPLLSFTVPAGLLLVFIQPLIPDVLQAVAIPVQYALDWIETVAGGFGTRGFSYITIEQVPVFLFPAWASGIFLLASIRIPALRWKMVVACLLSVNLMCLERIIQEPAHKILEVTLLDVGQGDAIHIKTPNGKHLLIDAGRWSPATNSGKQVLLPYFQHYNIDHLDAVILSHPHADHIGGMPDLIEGLSIGTIYQSDFHYESNLFSRYMELAAGYEIPVIQVTAGDKIDLDPALRIFVVGPEPGGVAKGNPNDYSVAVKIVYGQTGFLFTGDAEAGQERQMVRRYGDFLKTGFYKAAHHASNTSSTERFLQVVEPNIVAASLAFENRFGHPGREAVDRLFRHSARREFTSLSGALIFRSDGEQITLVDWITTKPR